MKSARKTLNLQFILSKLYVSSGIYRRRELVPDDVNPYLPIDFSFSSASNLYVARRALTYTIVFTPREYETFHRTRFFFARSLFLSTVSFSPPDQYSLPLATRSRHDDHPQGEKRKNEAEKRGPGEFRRKEKTHNVYSSPIEDERFQGSANVARI